MKQRELQVANYRIRLVWVIMLVVASELCAHGGSVTNSAGGIESTIIPTNFPIKITIQIFNGHDVALILSNVTSKAFTLKSNITNILDFQYAGFPTAGGFFFRYRDEERDNGRNRQRVGWMPAAYSSHYDFEKGKRSKIKYDTLIPAGQAVTYPLKLDEVFDFARTMYLEKTREVTAFMMGLPIELDDVAGKAIKVCIASEWFPAPPKLTQSDGKKHYISLPGNVIKGE